MGESISTELWNFAAAVKEHAFGGGFISGVLAISVWVVSALKPHKAAGNATAALISGLLIRGIAWIKTHRWALASNCVLIGTVWAAFLAYTDIDEQLKNPITVRFEWKNEEPFLRTDNGGVLWLRFKVHNDSANDFVCRVFLNKLEKDGQQEPIIPPGEDIELYPAGGEREEPSLAATERTVPGHDARLFNLAFLEKGADKLTMQSEQFHYEATGLASGKYRFTIQARNGRCRSDPSVIRVQYDGNRLARFFP
jgi:hypothetical protein